jgi:hypothetical protein
MTPASPRQPGTIDRRDMLRRAALLLGGAISAPTLAAMLAGCEAPASGEAGWTPRALSGERAALVATIAEHIIPTTDTPGARGAGVHRFVDRMLAEYYSADERAAFLAGLDDVDARARATGRAGFLELSDGGQRAVLATLDAEAYGRGTANGRPEHRPFFRTMKELTLLGYYTSETGATRELRYSPVPGRFDGCVPLSTIGRAWST